MAFRMPPPRQPRPPPGKLNLFVVNPVFRQNWCQDDGERDKTALVASRDGGHRMLKDFGRPQRENWNLPNEQPTITASDVDLKEPKVSSTNRALLLVMLLTCLVSIIALVLTVMMLFGKVGDQCGCTEKQGNYFNFLFLLFDLFIINT